MNPRTLAIATVIAALLVAVAAAAWSQLRRPTENECTALLDAEIEAEIEATIQANTPEELRGTPTEQVIATVGTGLADLLRENSQADDREIRQCMVTLRNYQVRARLRELGYD